LKFCVIRVKGRVSQKRGRILDIIENTVLDDGELNVAIEHDIDTIHAESVDIHAWFISFLSTVTGKNITAETSREEIRNMIYTVERGLTACVDRGETEDLSSAYPLKHSFAPGAYVREIFIPANNLVVGKIHKHEHVNFISKGRVTVITEQGGVEELVAPVTMISPAGVKRLLFTHEDTVWTVVHVTKETDLEKIEAQEIAQTYTEIGMQEPVLCIGYKG